jgi:membrane carboxypeptidase/penicillin-binding protein PbpC
MFLPWWGHKFTFEFNSKQKIHNHEIQSLFEYQFPNLNFDIYYVGRVEEQKYERKEKSNSVYSSADGNDDHISNEIITNNGKDIYCWYIEGSALGINKQKNQDEIMKVDEYIDQFVRF